MPSTVTDRLFGLTTSVAVKAPCRTVASTNITLAGLQTINGVTVVEGDRILVTGQTSGADNGIYVASTGAWSRSSDFDGNRDVVRGTLVLVVGSGSSAEIYEVTTSNPITIGSTSISFSLRYGANVRYDRTADEITAGVTPTNYAYPPLNWLRYGADPTGVSDSRSAIQSAVNVAAVNGGDPYGPAGTYLVTGAASADSYLNGIVIPYSTQNSLVKNVRLCGAGRSTILKCGTNGMVLVRCSASNSAVINMTLSNNSKTGCCGLGVLPESMVQTVTRVDQNYDLFQNLWIDGTFLEGIHMKAGPDVGGADSGCWYSTFISCHVRQATRGLFLDSPNNVGGSPVNRNRWFSCRFGEGMNTGVWIQTGGTNEFHGCSAEGVNTGASPSATPTAVVIKGATSATDNNRFFGWTNESCTRDVENENPNSEFYGTLILNALWTAEPLIIIGGYSASSTPQKALGFYFQTNSQFSGPENGAQYLATGRLQFPSVQQASSGANTLDDYKEGSFTPTIIGSSAAGTGTYSAQVGRYTKIGNRVFFSVSIAWSAHTGTGNMSIAGLPYTANSALSIACAVAASSITYTNQLTAYVLQNSTQVDLLTESNGGAIASLAIDTAGTLQVSGHYSV